MLNADLYRTTLSSTNKTFSFSAGTLSLNIELIWDTYTQALYDTLTRQLNIKAQAITYSQDNVFVHPADYMSYIYYFTLIPSAYATCSADIDAENDFTVIANDLSALITLMQNIPHIATNSKEIYATCLSNLIICRNAALQENRELLNEMFPSSTDPFIVLCNTYLSFYTQAEPVIQQYLDLLHWTVKLTDGNGNIRYIVLHNDVFYYADDSSYYMFATCDVDDIRRDNMPTVGFYIGVIKDE